MKIRSLISHPVSLFSALTTMLLAASVHAQLNWRDRHMEPTTLLVDVAHHDGLTVAVGSRSSYGYIHTTTNVASQEWTEYDLYQPAQFNAVPMAVAYFNGQWVITDFNGMATVTADFESFQRVSTGAFFGFSQLREINGRLYSPGNNGITSTANGTTWEFVQITEGATNYTEFTDVAYGAGRYVLSGRSSGQGVIYTSTNGTDWTAVYTPADQIQMVYSVEFADGKFLATGNAGLLMSSSDGLNWDIATSSGMLGTQYFVRKVGDHWLIGGVSLGYSSDDGEEFVADSMPRPSGRFGGIYKAIQAGDLRVAVGDNGMVFTEGEPPEPPVFFVVPQNLVPMSAGLELSISVSAIGFPNDIDFLWTWMGETVERPSTGTVARTSSLPIVVPGHDATITVEARSSGGSAFAEILIRGTAPTDWDEWTEYPDVLTDIRFQTHSAYGNGRYVYAYNGNPSASTPAGIVWSADGINWTVVELTPIHYVNALAFLNGRFVASTYNGTVHFSEDGENWSAPVPVVTEGGEHSLWLGVLGFINGYYFAGGRDMYRSTNLVDWEKLDVANMGNVRHMIEVDGALHALRVGATFELEQMMTTDGENWETSWIKLPLASTIHRFAFGNGRLVISGVSSVSGPTNWTAHSLDSGRTWTLTDIAGRGLINGPIQFTGDRFVLGTNQISDDAVNWKRTSASNGHLLVGGGKRLIGATHRVYVASLEVSVLQAGATPLGAGWSAHPWLGIFNLVYPEWVYHELLGWLQFALQVSHNEGAWAHSMQLGNWLWMSALAGYGYAFNPVDGMWYFWNAATRQWQAI